MQVALLKNSDNSFVLGAAFFTAFVGIFDTETGQIGFAESVRGLPGNSMTCVKNCGGEPHDYDDPDDPEPEEGEPIGPTPEQDPDSSSIKNAVFLVIALLVIAILVCGSIYWCKKRSARRNYEESKKVHGRSKKGKRGYSMQDEREDDDSDEEERMQIDYAKPMINN